MSAADMDKHREKILLAFAVEPRHDKATLERYLKAYPQYAEDLADVLSELRRAPDMCADVKDDEGAAARAWNAFAGTNPTGEPREAVANPFSPFQGAAFVALATELRIRRSILIALRDRIVLATSIPEPFLNRLAVATRSTTAALRAYLAQPATVAPAASYKSDVKPAAPDKIMFEQLLENSGLSPEEKNDILASPT